MVYYASILVESCSGCFSVLVCLDLTCDGIVTSFIKVGNRTIKWRFDIWWRQQIETLSSLLVFSEGIRFTKGQLYGALVSNYCQLELICNTLIVTWRHCKTHTERSIFLKYFSQNQSQICSNVWVIDMFPAIFDNVVLYAELYVRLDPSNAACLIAGVYAPGMPGTFSRHRPQRKPLVNDPDMRHGTCMTHVSWCMSGSLNRDGGKNVAGIPGACATHKFTYLVRGPLGG